MNIEPVMKIIKELMQLQIHESNLTHELTSINETRSQLLHKLDTNVKKIHLSRDGSILSLNKDFEHL